MTTSRTPYSAPPPGPRLRPSDERVLIAAAGRTTRRIALVALVLGLLALALTTWRTVLPAAAACQATTWDVTPGTQQIPTGWTLKGATFDVNRKTLSLVGPEPTDPQVPQAVVYVTVTCYPDGAADAVARSEAASKAAGQVVTDRPDLGDQAYTAEDSSGATFIQLRHGSVVVYLAASGDATPTEADQLASAFDRALGGDGGTIASALPVESVAPSDAGASPGSSDQGAVPSPAAPELEKLLPTKVGDLTLTFQSAVFTDISDQVVEARAITTALRAAGKTTDDFKVALATDGSDASQATITISAFSVNGMTTEDVRKLVLDSWLSASGAGVSRDTVTLGGHQFTRLDFGDEGTIDYVLAASGHVIVITTSNADLAAQAAAALP